MSSPPRLRKEGHLPFWTPGSGHYGNIYGGTGRKIVTDAMPFLLSWIDKVRVKVDGVFTIADIGSNDGYATLPLFHSVIRQLRQKHGEDVTVQVVYEDQEKSDYNSLFARIAEDSSPFRQCSRVYPMVTNVNFYQQCVPDGTCDVIFSSLACQWLDNPTTTFKDCVFHGSASEDELRQFRAEAERDWVQFLTNRARELKPGGLLLLLIPTARKAVTSRHGLENGLSDDDVCVKQQCKAEDTDTDALPYIDIWLDMEAAWTQLKDGKVITQEEYERCTATLLCRTPREITLPFESVTSPVRKAGLSLVEFHEVMSPCVYKAMWREKLTIEGADDREYFANCMVDAHRVWSYSTFHSSLSDMRSEEDKAAILDELYKRMKKVVMKKDPGTYRSDLPLSRLVAKKDVMDR